MNTEYDDNPEFGGGLINFASNGVENLIDAFRYGFRIGWQTHWHEVKELEDKLKQTINPSFNQELLEDKFIENYSPVDLPPMLSRKRGMEI